MDKKLLFKLRMYFVISSVLLGIVLFEVLSGRVSFLLAMIGLIIGVTIGVVAARMLLLSWHHEAKLIRIMVYPSAFKLQKSIIPNEAIITLRLYFYISPIPI